LFPPFLAAALAAIAGPSFAQSMPMNMPGMTMPMPAQKAPKKTQRKISKKGTAPKAGRAKDPGLEHEAHPVPPQGPIETPAPTPTDQAKTAPGRAPMQMPQQAPTEGGEASLQMPMGPMQMDGHASHPMAMSGAFGRYLEERETSGTAWQPDSSRHAGLMAMRGDWTLMAHGLLNLVYDHQSGPRGGNKAFASGMLMGMARRPLGQGTLQLKAMVSPDPFMGASGYPLLLASGETANGRDRLVDRQHPHDFFMELSGSVSQDIGRTSSIFLYAGLPGEPAFGPPAFMHRESILDSPEAPITHHWLDSTHITFGVVTAGLVLDRLKLDASRFNAREPDQHRWNIEAGALDSTSIRLSWNPDRTLALQGSWARLKDPEQLEPGVDQERWSASALWAGEFGPAWHAAATIAWGRKSSEGHTDDAVAAEASLKHGPWTIFSRAEWTENRELLGLVDSPAFRVGKISIGAIRDFAIARHLSFGAGGLLALDFVPEALHPLYGSGSPTGAMGFVRLKLD